MGDRAAKDALSDGFAGVARALGNGRRAEIVDLLMQAECSVDEVAGELGQSVANTSQHLQQLLRVGLVRTRRDGNRIYYSLASGRVAQLRRVVREVAALYPPFSNEVIALMRELIPTERRGRVAVAVVVKAFLPQMQ